MEPSEEIRGVVTRFFEALRDGDEEAVSNRISRQPGFERFGSDPGEWWQDGEKTARLLVRQMREMGGGYPWKLLGDIHAMSEDNVGWAGARTHFDYPRGAVEMRFTCVLHLEHGEWKLVQWHSSLPVSNEEYGFFLTTSVDEIAEAVSELRPDLSASSAADGTVTIAFTDIEDSLRLNALLGDRRWLDVLHAHNDVIRRVTAEHHGTLVKSQGDGSMLAFPSARRALTCAIAIDRAIAETFTDPARRSECASACTWASPFVKGTTSSVTRSTTPPESRHRREVVRSWSPHSSTTCSPRPGSSRSRMHATWS